MIVISNEVVEYLKEHLIDKRNRVCTIKMKFIPEFIQQCMNDNGIESLKELWYVISNNISSLPICPVCGKRVKYSDGKYYTYCSIKCSANAENTKSKRTKTSLEKYGCESPNQSDVVKEKKRQSSIEKYGCESPMQLASVREKQRQTLYSHYGVYSPAQNSEIKARMQTTCFERYGFKNPAQNDSVKKKIQTTCLDNYGTLYYVCSDDFKLKTQTIIKTRYRNGILSTN